MVSTKSVDEQLKRIKFARGWNRPETEELAAILLPDEEIFECVNGWYEGGYSLLCATNVRVLLIDKKPFRYLNVEDVRFDTINQIDYSHRLYNASICITAGLKNLVFRSYNQPRLRKLISHVQHRMAEIKKIEQVQKARMTGDMSEMDSQLRSYLMSQYEQHQSLNSQQAQATPEPVILDDEKSLRDLGVDMVQPLAKSRVDVQQPVLSDVSSTQLYQDGINEIFGRYQSDIAADPVKTTVILDSSSSLQLDEPKEEGLVVNPLKVAYSKLPLILSIKKKLVSSASTY